ncbi:hypothetical protein OROMI_027157 [Orobanche minor]
MDNTSSVSLILFDQHNHIFGHNAKYLKERIEQQAGGAMYDGCGDSHATCPRSDIVNESSSSILDNVADITSIDSYIKRRRLVSNEDLVVNNDGDWGSQHSTNIKDQAGVVKNVTELEDV